MSTTSLEMMRLHRQVLWISGVPILQKSKKLFLNIFGKIICFFNVETLAFLIYSQIYNIIDSNDLDIKARAFIMLSAGSNSIIKIPHLLFYQKEIAKLVAQVEEMLKRKDFLQNNNYAKWFIQCIRITSILLILSFVLAFGASTSMCLMPLVWTLTNQLEMDENATSIRYLPYLCHLPFGYDCFTTPFYEFLYGHQFLMGTLAALTTIAADLLPITFIMHATIHFRIIGQELKGTTSKETVIQCIKHHRRIIKFIYDMERVFNPMLMVQFVMSLLNFIFSAFKTMNDKDAMVSNTGIIIFILYNLWQLFFFCFFGELLMGQAIALANDGYNSGWVTMNNRDALLVKLFIQRAQQPVVVRVAVISKLDLDTFMSILRSSYSFLAVLNTMNK